jgi:hypothetical protein
MTHPTAPFRPARALRSWQVQIKRGATVIREFPAMGLSRVAVQKQHEGLCEAGAQCVVYPQQSKGGV